MNVEEARKKIDELQAKGSNSAIAELLTSIGHMMVDGQLVSVNAKQPPYGETHPLHHEQSGLGGK